MRFILGVALLTILLTISAPIKYEIYQENETGLLIAVVADKVNPTCTVKLNTINITMKHRDAYSEEEALESAAKRWEFFNKKQPENFSYATYVDMQRLVRDVYRKNSGKYRRPNTQEYLDEYLMDEFEYCIRSEF